MTPEERRDRARKGGLSTVARGHVNTEPAREAFLSQFSSEEDRRDYFRSLGRSSAVVRRLQKQASEGDEDAALFLRKRAIQSGREPRPLRRRSPKPSKPPYDPILALMERLFGRGIRLRWSVPAHAIARAHRARVWP